MENNDRIRLLIQKRTSLEAQIKLLTKWFDEKKFDNSTLKLRMNKLNELYNTFENLNDELCILDSETDHLGEFLKIQEIFYDVSGKIANVPGSTSSSRSSNASENNDSIQNINSRRRVKLPQASLPQFDGKYENWLSFKHAFMSLIDSQADLSDTDKLHYLQSALKGEAANKIRVFIMNDNNYAKAWDLLKRSYEVKRILISRHLFLLTHLPVQEKETANGLMKLADDAQQHILALNSLGVKVSSEMMVNILEGKLHKNTLEKWEETLERDRFPDIEEMFEFLYKTAVRLSKRERSDSTDRPHAQRIQPTLKRKRYNEPMRAMVTNVSNNCVVCKDKQHPLYKCEKFRTFSVPKRISVVKNAKLCYNCMRNHRDSVCKFNGCTICQKKHNTMLHLYKSYETKESDSIKNDSQLNESSKI